MHERWADCMRTGFNARRYSKPRIGLGFAKDIKNLLDRLVGIQSAGTVQYLSVSQKM